MADHTDVVAAVKEDLLAKGIDLSGPCGAFQITSRVAWQLRAEGWGLIAKNPGQNGCTVDSGRYAVDAIMTPDGTVIDLLINSETENRPGWQVVGGADAGLWRAPFNPDGAMVPPAPGPVPVPGPLPVPAPVPGPAAACGCAERLDAMSAKLEALTRSIEALGAKPAPPAPEYRGSIAGVQVVLHPSQ